MRWFKKKEPAPKVMDEAEMWRFINAAHRTECDANEWVYTKAIRASLIALGYDQDWVNGPFREALETSYAGGPMCGTVGGYIVFDGAEA